MTKRTSFAFYMSNDEASQWKRNLEMVKQLPQPSSGSKQTVNVESNKISITYTDKTGALVYSYLAEKSSFSEGAWVVSYTGLVDDFGYGDVGLMCIPFKKMTKLRQCIAAQA